MAPRQSARTDLERQTYIALLKVAGELEREVVELLKTQGLSLAQYNVLRILRGAGGDGATCGQVGGRLIKHDPDVTRLVDRLIRAGLVERARDTRDRRVVRTSITEAGLKVLAELDDPMDALHRRQLGHMSESALESLQQLLGAAGGR
jgi:DNA-binding MarR family transcriptional regulator